MGLTTLLLAMTLLPVSTRAAGERQATSLPRSSLRGSVACSRERKGFQLSPPLCHWLQMGRSGELPGRNEL